MARKNLLQGLMDGASEVKPKAARVDAARPRYSTGAIGAVSQSIAELKSRSIIEVEAGLIDTGGLRDRLDVEDQDIDALAESMREYGQQVPVLVRPHPENEDRFQVVYGRRRIAALKKLGRPVKVMVRKLDDRELIIAQGQENAARKDLSFVEKSIFSKQMRDAGYERKIICDALHVDKTLISRMLSVADRVPIDLVEAIGAAPGIGRDRWMHLADLMQKGADRTQAKALCLPGQASDKRFEAVVSGLGAVKERSKPPALPAQVIKDELGREVATLIRSAGKMTVTLQSAKAGGFDQWLADNLETIHRDWATKRT